MKKTAIDWLIEQWPILESQLPPWLIEQAKAMEKEQIIDAYLKDRIGKFDVVLKLMDKAEQYYNETFKAEE